MPDDCRILVVCVSFCLRDRWGCVQHSATSLQERVRQALQIKVVPIMNRRAKRFLRIKGNVPIVKIKIVNIYIKKYNNLCGIIILINAIRLKLFYIYSLVFVFIFICGSNHA